MPNQSIDLLTGHANEWYVDAAEALITDGQPVVSRGRAVHETLHAVLRMPDPRKRVLTIPFRRANPFFQAAEAVWILAGRADAQWILAYNKQLGQFLDTAVPRPGFFHGAYGERLRSWGKVNQLDWHPSTGTEDQLQYVLHQLRKDPGSRRAVAVLHNPHVDNPHIDTLDRPCNIAVTYQQRGGALHAMTFNRSNDLTLGLSYTNIVQFTTIQEFLAAALGLDVGAYTHISSSLHVYDNDAVARRCIGGSYYRFDVYDHVGPTPMKRWMSANEGFDLMERLTGHECPPLDCPYWESVRGLLEVWGVLKLATVPESQGEHAERAAVKLLALPAQDWGIAALEFLYRWARNRKVDDRVLAVVVGAKLPDPVVRFIAHDTEK